MTDAVTLLVSKRVAEKAGAPPTAALKAAVVGMTMAKENKAIGILLSQKLAGRFGDDAKPSTPAASNGNTVTIRSSVSSSQDADAQSEPPFARFDAENPSSPTEGEKGCSDQSTPQKAEGTPAATPETGKAKDKQGSSPKGR